MSLLAQSGWLKLKFTLRCGLVGRSPAMVGAGRGLARYWLILGDGGVLRIAGPRVESKSRWPGSRQRLRLLSIHLGPSQPSGCSFIQARTGERGEPALPLHPSGARAGMRRVDAGGEWANHKGEHGVFSIGKSRGRRCASRREGALLLVSGAHARLASTGPCASGGGSAPGRTNKGPRPRVLTQTASCGARAHGPRDGPGWDRRKLRLLSFVDRARVNRAHSLASGAAAALWPSGTDRVARGRRGVVPQFRVRAAAAAS